MNSDALSNQIINGIKSIGINPTFKNPIATHEPFFQGTNATSYVNDCINSGWVSSTGKWVNKFEDEICKFTGAKHCIAVNNGTAALRLALHASGVKNNDEVIIPPLSFVATSNAVSHLGAYPHFVDIEKDTYGMSPEALATRLEKIGSFKDGKLINKLTGRRISAVIAVHVFGNPANTYSLLDITSKWNLPLIEDAAEALGSWNKRKTNSERIHCGLIGDIGIFSFNGNKIITTGGGGAIITNESYKAKLIRHLSTTAKQPHPWAFFHDQMAWNDRMPNLNAALGVSQMETINKRIKSKKLIYEKYKNVFSNIEEVDLIKCNPNSITNNWLISIRFNSKDYSQVKKYNSELLRKAHEIGLLLRPIWKPLNQLPMYKDCPKGLLLNSEGEYERIVNLPSSPQLIKQYE